MLLNEIFKGNSVLNISATSSLSCPLFISRCNADCSLMFPNNSSDQLNLYSYYIISAVGFI